MNRKIQHAINKAKLLKTSSRKGLYAPGSIVQVLSRSLALLNEFEDKLHSYCSGNALRDWIIRIKLIREQGYGLNLIPVPCQDYELNELDNVDDYMKQLRKLRGIKD